MYVKQFKQVARLTRHKWLEIQQCALLSTGSWCELLRISVVWSCFRELVTTLVKLCCIRWSLERWVCNVVYWTELQLSNLVTSIVKLLYEAQPLARVCVSEGNVVVKCVWEQCAKYTAYFYLCMNFNERMTNFISRVIELLFWNMPDSSTEAINHCVLSSAIIVVEQISWWIYCYANILLCRSRLTRLLLILVCDK